MNPDFFLHNTSQVVTVDEAQTSSDNPLGVIPKGVVAVEGEKIAWIGSEEEINQDDYLQARWIDMQGHIVMPGLIDSHTHPIFAGNRADEFEMRLQGKSYLEIAEAGGGIKRTVEETRKAHSEILYQSARERILTMMTYGVTTVEAKSGYGLDWDSERKSLNVIKRLKESLPVSIFATYMGAHDIPPEFKGREDMYVDALCTLEIPQVAKRNLADFCDVFCETGYFDVEQSRKILYAAKAHGLKLKLHAEEFTCIGGAELAAEVGAVSADHLLHISDAGIEAMAKAGTVATLLPGTAFFLRLADYAPARKIIDGGVDVALATDFNPGSCMTENLQLIMTLACLEMGMQPVDVIKGVTINAAKALDTQHDRGSLTVGKRADIVSFGVSSYNELLYHYGVNHLSNVYIAGQSVLSLVSAGAVV